jgi:tRNA1Val (adenine37-N6)-methyltransferase
MDMRETTADRFLGGRVHVRQFARGFRSGLDAVMLAAAVPAKAGDTALELGSGAGVASLCLGSRVAECTVTGVELDHDLVSLANANAAANQMSERVRFVRADAMDLPRDLCTQFDHVLCNPPFHDSEGQSSQDSTRARALQDSGDLSRWLESGIKRTASNGTFTVILRTDRMSEAFSALPADGTSVFPLWPKVGTPAKRVLIQVHLGGRAPMILLPGIVLHAEDGCYTPEAERILRGGAALDFNSRERRSK